jgi:hypothetical protein
VACEQLNQQSRDFRLALRSHLLQAAIVWGHSGYPLFRVESGGSKINVLFL